MAKRLKIAFEKLLELTHRVDFFETMSDIQRVKVLQSLEGDLFVYEPDEIIINEGEQKNHLFIILSGEVSVEKGGDECSVVCNLKGGDFFGEVSFIMGSKRIASVYALRETIVLQLSQRKFNALDIEIQMLIKDKVIRKLIYRLDEMNRQVLKLQSLQETVDLDYDLWS